ncbi:hypothetical protein AHAS_Ahas13G0134700 [Arachis hypogaea]
MLSRWIGSLIITCIYVLHVYLIQGFYIVSYGLGIYMLNSSSASFLLRLILKFRNSMTVPPFPLGASMSSVPLFAASLNSSSGMSDAGDVRGKPSNDGEEEPSNVVHFRSGGEQRR